MSHQPEKLQGTFRHLDQALLDRGRGDLTWHVNSGWFPRSLTIGIHVVTWHLWWGEALLERVRGVAVLVHRYDLLLRGCERGVGSHHPFHPVGQHFCKERRAVSSNVCH